MTTQSAAKIIPAIVQQHAEDAAMLASNRLTLIKANNARLDTLRRFDCRLAAHFDGLRIAGEQAWPMSGATLEAPSPGAVFAVAVRVIEEKDEARLARLLGLVEAVPDTTAGLLAAFGWVDDDLLQGTVVRLLRDHSAFARMVGLAACALHRADPGAVADDLVRDPAAPVRARALRIAGELGRVERQSLCVDAIVDPDEDCRFWAAWSAVLLGDRDEALEAIARVGETEGAHRKRAFRLALQTMPIEAGHGLLEELGTEPRNQRWLIEGAGIAGDPMYVPWLLGRMDNTETARLAGAAFTLITALDLAALDGGRYRPDDVESAPSVDADDTDVDADPDEGLPWPDVAKIEQWWTANEARFQKGTRHFMGAPVTRGHCIDVLKNGFQRQRILAAHYLCLLEPGTPLFNTSAPAWRQQRLLAKMS